MGGGQESPSAYSQIPYEIGLVRAGSRRIGLPESVPPVVLGRAGRALLAPIHKISGKARPLLYRPRPHQCSRRRGRGVAPAGRVRALPGYRAWASTLIESQLEIRRSYRPCAHRCGRDAGTLRPAIPIYRPATDASFRAHRKNRAHREKQGRTGNQGHQRNRGASRGGIDGGEGRPYRVGPRLVRATTRRQSMAFGRACADGERRFSAVRILQAVSPKRRGLLPGDRRGPLPRPNGKTGSLSTRPTPGRRRGGEARCRHGGRAGGPAETPGMSNRRQALAARATWTAQVCERDRMSYATNTPEAVFAQSATPMRI